MAVSEESAGAGVRRAPGPCLSRRGERGRRVPMVYRDMVWLTVAGRWIGG